jgi:hypothetical protein
VSSRRGIVESAYPLGCSSTGGYVTLAQNVALFAQVGYCERIGVIDDEQGEIRAVLKNDVISPHLSLGVRVFSSLVPMISSSDSCPHQDLVVQLLRVLPLAKPYQ